MINNILHNLSYIIVAAMQILAIFTEIKKLYLQTLLKILSLYLHIIKTFNQIQRSV